jgi:adenosylhomocysteine nucleosidase
MESAMVRRAAAGISVIAVRAITDTAAQDVDPALLELLDGQGRVRGGALVGMLLRRPGKLGQLLRLRAAARLAGRRLGDAIRIILDGMM